MPDHFHFGVDAFLFIGTSAWLFLALLKIIAARLATSDGVLGTVGAAIGGTL